MCSHCLRASCHCSAGALGQARVNPYRGCAEIQVRKSCNLSAVAVQLPCSLHSLLTETVRSLCGFRAEARSERGIRARYRLRRPIAGQMWMGHKIPRGCKIKLCNQLQKCCSANHSYCYTRDMMKHDMWLAELQICNWLLNSNWLQSFMLHPPHLECKDTLNYIFSSILDRLNIYCKKTTSFFLFHGMFILGNKESCCVNLESDFNFQYLWAKSPKQYVVLHNWCMLYYTFTVFTFMRA